MTRHRKWLKLGLLAAAALLVAQVGVGVLSRTQIGRRYLLARLERAFGRPVEVRYFDAQVFPSLRLDASGISVAEDPAFGNEYFLRAEKLTAGLRWLGLLRGHFEFGTLSLSRPSLILVRSVDKRELINAMVWVTLPALIGPLLGPPLGGFITTYISWHWIFLINIPIGLTGIVLATIFIEDVRAQAPDPFDPLD